MVGEKLRPDIAEVSARWESYWQGENSRPMIWATCVAEGEDVTRRIGELTPRYPQRPTDDFVQIAENVLELKTTCFDYVADEVPYFDPSFGPEQISAFFGQTIEYSDHSQGTSWSKPMEGELEELIALIAEDPSNPAYKVMIEYHKKLAEICDGRVVIGGLDYHSNFDCIASLRDPVNACIDMMEKPELMKEALRRVSEAYGRFCNKFYDAARMAEVGTGCWVAAYSTGKYITLNSDFVCMLSPEQVDEFVIPCLETECSVVDHAIYHLDGPDAMKHMKSIAAVDKIRAIQWTPGSGNPDNGPYWLDFYREILSTGKGIWMSAGIDTIKELHKELKSTRIIYGTWGTRQQVEELLRWFDNN